LLPPAAKQRKSVADFAPRTAANKLKSVAEDDMRALFCAAHGANEFDRFSPRHVRGKKRRRLAAAHGGKKIEFVAEDDMCVRSDTLQCLER